MTVKEDGTSRVTMRDESGWYQQEKRVSKKTGKEGWRVIFVMISDRLTKKRIVDPPTLTTDRALKDI